MAEKLSEWLHAQETAKGNRLETSELVSGVISDFPPYPVLVHLSTTWEAQSAFSAIHKTLLAYYRQSELWKQSGSRGLYETNYPGFQACFPGNQYTPLCPAQSFNSPRLAAQGVNKNARAGV